MEKIAIIGSGTWGSALAQVLSNQGHEVTLFSAVESDYEFIKEHRRNKNLPNMEFNSSIVLTKDPEEAVKGKVAIILATPSIYIRKTAERIKPYVSKDQIIINVAKGIENSTLFTLGEVIKEVLPDNAFVVLSGPTHAEEVAVGLPSTIVSASTNINDAIFVANLFKGSCIRVYLNTDVVGVELCGALKNVIALAAGISQGLGYGDNIKAGIITRGMNEISRIGKAMGCFAPTFYGLAGVGDLIVTATSQHSRNNKCGQLIGKGLSPKQAIEEVGMVVEGINALEPALKIAKLCNVKVRIIETLDKIINGNAPVKEMFDELIYDKIKLEID